MEKIAVQLLPVEIAVVVCNPYTFGDRLEFMLSKVKGRLPHPISHIKWIGSEPSLFGALELCLQRDCIHFGTEEMNY